MTEIVQSFKTALPVKCDHLAAGSELHCVSLCFHTFLFHTHTALCSKLVLILSEVQGTPSVFSLLSSQAAALSSTVRALNRPHCPGLSQALVGQRCHNLQKRTAGRGFT